VRGTDGFIAARSTSRRINDLLAAAAAILNRLYFREERSVSSTLKVPAPFGLEANGGRNLLYEGRPWTPPEIAHQFRTFVQALSDSGYRVVIAIDELDKVDDDEEVIRLLNDVKALFGIPNCYFLVAVSVSAMIRFQQRGLPFQDAFESALEDVIQVEPLTATETVELLQRRLTGIPAAAALLCHVLGAGLPRDVIRVLRSLTTDSTVETPPSPQEVVATELRTRLQAARIRMQLEGRDLTEFVRNALTLTRATFDLQKWLDLTDPALTAAWERLRETASQPPGDQSAPANRDDDLLVIFVGWALTCAEFARTITDASSDDIAARMPLAHDLAVCRRTLAIDIRDAFQQLHEARAALGMRI
jgi:hypothetical protein